MNKLFSSQPGSRLQVAALVVIVATVFGNSLFNGFVWDDTILFINHEPYRNFDLKRMLLSSGNGLEYLPLRDLSIALDHLLWGQKPFGFHLSNLLIYTLITISFFLVLQQLAARIENSINGASHQRQLTPPGWPALLATILFAIHPIHAEAVNFITSRNTLLAGLFYLLSLLLFLKHVAEPDRKRYLLSLLLFAAALLSKATALALPIVLFFVCRLYGIGVKRSLRLILPFAVTACLLAALHIYTASHSGVITGSLTVSWESGAEKVATVFRIPAFYLEKLLCPAALTIEYQWPPEQGVPLSIISATLLLCCLIFFSRNRWQSHPAGAVAAVLFFANLLPVMNLLPTTPVVADRYAFLPSLGFSLGCALLLTGLSTRLKKTALPAGILIIASLSVLSFRQNFIWKSDSTLFEHAIRHAPATSRLVTDLGRIYFFAGNYGKAFELFRKAGDMNPSDPTYDYFHGFVCLNLNRDISCARENLTRALRKNPDFIEALYYLGVTSEVEGDMDGAMTLYRRATDSPLFDISRLKPKAAEKYQRLTNLPRQDSVHGNDCAEDKK